MVFCFVRKSCIFNHRNCVRTLGRAIWQNVFHTKRIYKICRYGVYFHNRIFKLVLFVLYERAQDFHKWRIYTNILTRSCCWKLDSHWHCVSCPYSVQDLCWCTLLAERKDYVCCAMYLPIVRIRKLTVCSHYLYTLYFAINTCRAPQFNGDFTSTIATNQFCGLCNAIWSSRIAFGCC